MTSFISGTELQVIVMFREKTSGKLKKIGLLTNIPALDDIEEVYMILLLRKTWAETCKKTQFPPKFVHINDQSMSSLIIYHIQICTMLP